MKKDAWERFMKTGSVDDYLNYKKKQRKYLEEMSTDVYITGRDRNDRNHRRGSSKDE
ncbi:MAG: hypothetical protein GX490_00625 [Bacilli bacterium]|nr:hypothetical protein [Bacilli bacterium]